MLRSVLMSISMGICGVAPHTLLSMDSVPFDEIALSGFSDREMTDRITEHVNKMRGFISSHQKERWVDGFIDAGAVVEDPVESNAHKNLRIGKKEITQYYNSFIKKYDIWFKDRLVLTSGMSQWRQSDMIICSGNKSVSIPAYFHYQLVQQGSQLKVKQINSYWQKEALERGMKSNFVRSVGNLFSSSTVGMSPAALYVHMQGMSHSNRFYPQNHLRMTEILPTGGRRILKKTEVEEMSFTESVRSGAFVVSAWTSRHASTFEKQVKAIALTHFREGEKRGSWAEAVDLFYSGLPIVMDEAEYEWP